MMRVIRRTFSKYGQTEVPFGFKNVSVLEKPKLVKDVFEKVAAKYDLMNDVMTAGIHRSWKDHFASYFKPFEGMRVLDVAGGTGDIAFRLVSNSHKHSIKDYQVTVVDVNEKMLEVGKERGHQRGYIKGIEWVIDDAEKLSNFKDNSFDCYTIAFGIRNCTNILNVLNQANRILRPGGQFLCLELSPGAFSDKPLLKSLYDRYSFEIVPALGHLLASDWGSYQYLVESIRRFPDQSKFANMILEAGFERVSFEDLFGGVCAIHFAWKPL